MKYISIKGDKSIGHLNKEIKLNNGSLVVMKANDNVENVYMVVSFRDHKGRYEGSRTEHYCTLVNLDSGTFAFEERCSRKTTVRRILRHLNRLGYQMPYDPDDTSQDEQLKNFDIDVYPLGGYKIQLELIAAAN